MTLSYDRRVIAVSGADARRFLQGLLTQDMARISGTELQFAAMLSPQGKLLYDGFLRLEGEAVLWDVAASQAEALLAALRRYKLRSAVTLELRDAAITFHDADNAPDGAFADPRHPAMPHRVYGVAASVSHADSYHRARFAFGLPEAAFDTDGSDVAMDMGYDALGAISFSKGCYVGQEVTARMHYKQIARKQVMCVAAADTLEGVPEHTIRAGDLVIGEMRSYMGNAALALVKLEPWQQALEQGRTMQVADRVVTLQVPEWGKPRVEQFRQGKVTANAQI